MRRSILSLFSALLIAITALAAVAPRSDVVPAPQQDLWRRRGGGGGGGGRGGGGGGSSGGSSGGGRSGGSSSSGSSSSSSGGGGKTGGRGSSSSASGGRTTTGSGPPPAYGGGRYYGGGAAVPYQAGSRSPSGITPIFLGAGLGLAFWPGALWLHGCYLYPYSRPYSYYNASSKQNETKPATCGCDPTLVCGCDENGDQQYLSDIIGNGTNLNSSLVSVATVNGTQRILVNGTLPNGTTAAGGDEDPFDSAGMRLLLQNAGWWPVVAIVSAMVFAI